MRPFQSSDYGGYDISNGCGARREVGTLFVVVRILGNCDRSDPDVELVQHCHHHLIFVALKNKLQWSWVVHDEVRSLEGVTA